VLHGVKWLGNNELETIQEKAVTAQSETLSWAGGSKKNHKKLTVCLQTEIGAWELQNIKQETVTTQPQYSAPFIVNTQHV